MNERSILKAWRINEYDVWAAETMDQAVEACMKEQDLPREDCYDELYAREESPDLLVEIDNGDEVLKKVTIAELLDGKVEPQALCTYDR